MSDEKSGPSINIGEITGGNQAIGAEQHVDQRQHTEVDTGGGNANISNTQINADIGDLSAEQIEALKGMGATEEEVGLLTSIAKDLRGAGDEMAPALEPLKPLIAKFGGPMLAIARGVLPGWAGAILDAVV